MAILSLLGSCGPRPGFRTYAALIRGYGLQGDVSNTKELGTWSRGIQDTQRIWIVVGNVGKAQLSMIVWDWGTFPKVLFQDDRRWRCLYPKVWRCFSSWLRRSMMRLSALLAVCDSALKDECVKASEIMMNGNKLKWMGQLNTILGPCLMNLKCSYSIRPDTACSAKGWWLWNMLAYAMQSLETCTNLDMATAAEVFTRTGTEKVPRNGQVFESGEDWQHFGMVRMRSLRDVSRDMLHTKCRT